MKIAVIGANSTLGRKVVLKAEEKGIGVIGMVRSAENLVGNGPLVLKDYPLLQSDDLEGCHCIVDTVSFVHIERYSTEMLPLWRLLEIVSPEQQLLCVGSCAFLYTDESRRQILLESGMLCNENDKGQLRQCVNAYERLRMNESVRWSVLCPPLILDRRGYGTGRIEFAGDVFPLGLDGHSQISVVDLASAVIELLLRGLPEHGLVSVRSLPR